MPAALPASTPTVVHIEDDPMWADVVVRVLEKEAVACHLGSARTGAEGLALCRETHPEIVLLDLCLPDLDGLKVAELLTALPNPPRILFLSVRADELTLFRAWSGASGLIWKWNCPSVGIDHVLGQFKPHPNPGQKPLWCNESRGG